MGDFGTRCKFKKIEEKQYEFIMNNPYIRDDNFINELKSEHEYTEAEKIIEGDLIMFDSCLPHYTERSNQIGRGRISLDWRFKFNDPYDQYEKKIEEIEIRNNKYWYICDEKVTNMDEKYEVELLKIKKNYGIGEAYYYRQKEYYKYKNNQ
jgi:hypothetical protein